MAKKMRLNLPGYVGMDGESYYEYDLNYMNGSIAKDTSIPELPSLPQKDVFQRPQTTKETVFDDEYIKNAMLENIAQRENEQVRMMQKYKDASNPITKWMYSQSEKDYNQIKSERDTIDQKLQDETIRARYQKDFEAQQKAIVDRESIKDESGLKKFLGKTWYSASESAFPGAISENSKLKGYSEATGNNFADATANFIGGTLGMAMPFAPGSEQSMMNVADNIAEGVAKKVAPKMPQNLAGRIGTQMVRGGVDGAIGGVYQTTKEGLVDGESDAFSNIGMGALGGAAMFGGGKALGEGMDYLGRLKALRDIANPDVSNLPTTEPMPIREFANVKEPMDNLKSDLNKFDSVRKDYYPFNDPNQKMQFDDMTRPDPYRDTYNEFMANQSKVNDVGNVPQKPIQDAPIPQQQAKPQIVGDNFKIRNDSLDQAYNDYNEAIKQMQHYVGHYKMTDDEILGAADALNIDIFKLVDNIDIAEKTKFDANKINNQSHWNRVMGLSDIPKNITTINRDIPNVVNDPTKPPSISNITNLKDSGLNLKSQFNPMELESPRLKFSPRDIVTMEQELMLLENTGGSKAEINGLKRDLEIAKMQGGPNAPVPPVKEAIPSLSMPKKKDEVIPMAMENKLPVDATVSESIPSLGDKSTYAETGTNNSKLVNNTYVNSTFMGDESTQKIVKEMSDLYDQKPHEESFDIAKEMVARDFEGTKARITENGLRSSEDTAASALITQKYIDDGDAKSVNEWLKIVRPKATELGQALEAFKIWKELTPQGTLLKAQRLVDSAMNEIAKKEPKKVAKAKAEIEANPQDAEAILKKYKLPQLTEGDTKYLLDQINRIDKLKDGESKDIEIARMKKYMAELLPSTLADKFKAYQRMNLLLNTKTMIRNVAGNVFMGGLETLKDVPGAFIDDMIAKKTGVKTTDLPSMTGKWNSIKGGIKQVAEDYKLDINRDIGEGRYDLPITQAFRKVENPTRIRDYVNNFLAKSEKLVNTGLRMGDVPFFKAAYDSELMGQMIRAKVDTPTEAMMQKALDVAEETTFQNKSGMVNAFNDLKKFLNKANIKGVGLGDFVMPFVKTPANILDKALDYSPVGGYRGIKEIVTKMGTEEFNQKKAVDQLSRGLTGTALMGLGVYLASTGTIHGRGSDDFEAQALEQQAGKLPYSIKLGNKYHTIDWNQPAAIPLMIGADMYNGYKKGAKKDTMVADAVTSGFATLFNQSLLQGVTNLFGGYSQNEGENIVGGVKNAALSSAQQLVPFNSALRQVAQLSDNKSRSTYSDSVLGKEFNKSMAKIPSLSKNLPVSIDTVGNEKTNNNGSKGLEYVFDTLLNPSRSAKYEPTNAEKLALDLYDRTGETKHMPRYADKEITYKDAQGQKQTLKLDAQDKMDLQRRMGELTEQVYSQYATKNGNIKDEDQINQLMSILNKIEDQAKKEILKSKGIKYKK